MTNNPFEFEAFKQVNAIVEDRERKAKKPVVKYTRVKIKDLEKILHALQWESERTGPECYCETNKVIELVEKILKHADHNNKDRQ